jgi:hypothetical protein
MMATHHWPGVRANLRLVPKSDAEAEEELAANRSTFDEYATPIRTRASDRSLPLRRKPISVGGGALHRLWLIVRDTWRYLAGPSALVRVRKRGRRA